MQFDSFASGLISTVGCICGRACSHILHRFVVTKILSVIASFAAPAISAGTHKEVLGFRECAVTSCVIGHLYLLSVSDH